MNKFYRELIPIRTELELEAITASNPTTDILLKLVRLLERYIVEKLEDEKLH